MFLRLLDGSLDTSEVGQLQNILPFLNEIYDVCSVIEPSEVGKFQTFRKTVENNFHTDANRYLSGEMSDIFSEVP